MAKWVIGALSGGAIVSGLIIGLYGAKDNMPPPLFNFLLIFLIICLALLFLTLIFSVIRFCIEWNRSFEFVGKWYCQYNAKTKHIELHGNVDLHSSGFSKAKAVVTQNCVTYQLSNQPVMPTLTLKDRYALSFARDDVSISLEKLINIRVDIYLKNLKKKTYIACLPVIPVGG